MDRDEFAKRLHASIVPAGTSEEEMKKLLFPISEAIFQMMPNSLFRYRPLNNDLKNNKRQIDAFKNDAIYAVTADKFNDPYDTLVRYDKEEIKRSVNTIVSYETIEGMKAWFAQGKDLPEEVKQILPGDLIDFLKDALLSIDDFTVLKDNIEESRRNLVNLIESYFPILTETTKRYSTMACFSESVNSVLMWSHYANSHQGFALEYDFRPTLEKPIKNVGLYPVIYDDERMDVSLYMAWSFLRMLGIEANNPDITSFIKIALHKSSIWAYEKEWRMIDCTLRDITDSKPSEILYKPMAIYYGRHISKEHKELLHEIAQAKGIKEYEMYIDYTAPEYEMSVREYRGIGPIGINV